MPRLRHISVLILILLVTLLARHNTELITNAPESVAVATTSQSASVATPADAYRVVKVVDGDTLTISKGGKNVTLRLIGVDTPETVDPRKPVQCFGKAASDKAKELLTGKSVRLEMDPSQGEFDKYGRTLAYVYLPDGTLFNQFMIAEGYGHEYTYHLPYKYQKEFKAAEVAARTAAKGLWAPGVCETFATASHSVIAAAAPQAGAAFSPTKQYDCTKNSYNCPSFSSHAEAQYVFDLCGGVASDVHKLDRDGDGRICESIP